MPRLALALALLWFFVLFVYRTYVQWRATGSSGVVGFHGAIASTPWFAGVAVLLGFVLAPLSPLAALADWPAGSLGFHHEGLHVVGAALAVVGIAGGCVAQLAMGSSWRIGVDEKEKTALVTEGLYAWVRNPIYTFVGISLVGFCLLVPNAWSLAAAALAALGIELQVRAVEEPHLLRMHGERYGRYAAGVGRFVPGFGHLRERRGEGRSVGAS